MKAEELKRMRENKGVSQPELAKKLGVSVRQIVNLENGKTPIRDIYIEKITTFLNIKEEEKEVEDNSGLTEREHKLLEAYRSLPAEKKEMYFYKIMGDALEHEVMSNPIGGANARTATSTTSQKTS